MSSPGGQLSPAVGQKTLMGVMWTGWTFSMAVVSTRMIFRLRVFKGLKVDDYFVIAALVFNTISTTALTIRKDDFYVMMDNVSTVHTVDINEILAALTSIARAMRGVMTSYLCFWFCLWSIKLSFMFFFYNLGRQIRSQMIFWWCVLAFIIASLIVCLGIFDYRCMSSKPMDIEERCNTEKVINYEYMGTIVSTTLDIVSDALIVFLSGNLVWRIRMPWQKKLALTCICSLTICMVVVAVIRINMGRPGKLPHLTWTMLWNSIEMTLAIFVACIASFRSLYTRTLEAKKKETNGIQPSSFHQSKKRVLRSVFGTESLLNAEVPLWENQHQLSQDHSREDLWNPANSRKPNVEWPLKDPESLSIFPLHELPKRQPSGNAKTRIQINGSRF